jgi:hypothetical protein
VEANGAGQNGSGGGGIRLDRLDRRAEAPPDRVSELADACVRFVERAVGVKLDYTLETLPIVDHYLAQARENLASAAAKPEAGALVAHAAGVYFGEVVRRRHPSWWRLRGDDPGAWRVELEPVYLSFSPVELVTDALARQEEEDDEAKAFARLELQEEDRAVVAARLANLPPVDEDTYHAPSTWLEVIDIAVDAIRARRLGEGEEADAALQPRDYDTDEPGNPGDPGTS